MATTVPRMYRGGLYLLRDLEADDAERLRKALCGAESFLPFQALTGVVAEALPSHDTGDALSLVNSLFGLRTQLRLSESPPAKFAEDVADALDHEGLTPEAQQRFAELLESLLECAAIETSSAAAELTVLAEHPYRSARVLSDIRPVFGKDVKQPPRGAVVMHRLTLSFWNANGDREGIEVVLDQSDLEELGGVVERALDKASTLRTVLTAAGLVPFEIEGGNRGV